MLDEKMTIRHWYAMYTKPRSEFAAAKQLRAEGIEIYLPTATVIRQWSDRKKKLTEPVFKSYIFVHCNEKERLIAVQQKAIVKTVSFLGKPSIIPDWEIESLRKTLERTNEFDLSDKPKIGQKVKIVDGPFKGVVGTVYEDENQERYLAVTIELLRRAVVVHLPAGNVVEFVGEK